VIGGAVGAHAAPIIDPVGDTFGAGPVQIDITSIDAISSSTSLTFLVNFAGTISPASSGLVNSLSGFIDIDADRNAATGGGGSNQGTFGLAPAPSLNDEFFIDLSTEAGHPGQVDVVNAITFATLGTAPISFGANLFSTTLPLSLLGSSDGVVNYRVLVGTALEPTDEAVNGSGFATNATAAGPEPSSLLLAAAGLALVAVRRYRR
jgi:MYXO-CTERM domain-containing protein